MLFIDGGEGCVELFAHRLWHHGRIAEGHLQALVPQHPSDGLEAHPVLAPLNGERVTELMARVPGNTGLRADGGDEVVEAVGAHRTALPGEAVITGLLGALVPEERLRAADAHPGVDALNQSWLDRHHAIVVELAHRDVQPVGDRHRLGVLGGHNAAGVQAAEFASPQSRREQHAEDCSYPLVGQGHAERCGPVGCELLGGGDQAMPVAIRNEAGQLLIRGRTIAAQEERRPGRSGYSSTSIISKKVLMQERHRTWWARESGCPSRLPACTQVAGVPYSPTVLFATICL